MPPTSIDGTDISGLTIDGTEVSEVTMDGDVVFSSSSLSYSGDINNFFALEENESYTTNDFALNYQNRYTLNSYPVGLDSDGSYIYIVLDDGTVEKYDFNNNLITSNNSSMNNESSISVTQDGNLLAVQENSPADLVKFDTDLNELDSASLSFSVSLYYDVLQNQALGADKTVVNGGTAADSIAIVDNSTLNEEHTETGLNGLDGSVVVDSSNSHVWAADKNSDELVEMDDTLSEITRHNLSGSIGDYSMGSGVEGYGYILDINYGAHKFELSTGNIVQNASFSDVGSSGSLFVLPDGQPESGETIYHSSPNGANTESKFSNGDITNRVVTSNNSAHDYTVMCVDAPTSALNGNEHF